jgi:penicillin-insensitive murein endopeptidase
VRLLAVLLLLAVPALAAEPTVPAPAIAARTPSPGPAQVIGGNSGGCVAGAVRLPDEAPGMQTIRASKSHFWGHPDTIAGLKLLAERAQAAGLPSLYMNDISNPRGGPMTAGGHVSHQRGIEADVWLDVTPPHPLLTAAQREALEPVSLVRPDGRAVDPARWKPGHITLLRLAATLPRVDRLLVNPAIKKQLCAEVTGDRSWLRLVRPWYGHAAHFHISFNCPAGSPLCTQPPPPPPGDGCDATLQWWFDQLDAPPKPAGPATRRAPPRLPAACGPVMAAPDK